ncbi:50S ribosomal protein L24 [Chitinibacter bivalviorum]|uniref:Large ribosomal subunit protein uL24 n=1 Tax=Chitinibacter bivalviorum TaxID=2739434 RepID=A0A7H9BJ75_9NEIS|nr:50S ribosomal protein L24 [Chitinibacter bivalviorum]QLG88700.1 50S ribosomal protein L24 [Chitinibacter bivalviorum]
MNKIRKGDEVVVLTGKDKGKRGTVVRALPATERVVVEGVNVVKKHQKPNPMRGVQGGIVELTMPVHVSNVAIFNAKTGKADRVGFKTLEDGKKVRVFKSSGEVVGG